MLHDGDVACELYPWCDGTVSGRLLQEVYPRLFLVRLKKQLLFHLFPVNKSLTLAVEFYGKPYDRAACATERFKIAVVYDLPFGGGDFIFYSLNSHTSSRTSSSQNSSGSNL